MTGVQTCALPIFLLSGGIGFDEIELKAGVTTEINPAIIRIVEGSDYYYIKSVATGETSAATVSGYERAVPAGKYTITSNDMPQPVEIDVKEGEIREVKMPAAKP